MPTELILLQDGSSSCLSGAGCIPAPINKGGLRPPLAGDPGSGRSKMIGHADDDAVAVIVEGGRAPLLRAGRGHKYVGLQLHVPFVG